MQKVLLSLVMASLGFMVPSAHAFLANAKMPACLDGPDELQIDNARVLKMKVSTRDAYLARAFVQGIVTQIPTVQHGHDHFVISIGPNAGDALEVIYNVEFGAMPAMRVGDPIIVCGDYITSTAQTGRYPASPEGAIIHWIHFNPGSRQGSATHAHGFVMTGSNLIGFDTAPPGDWAGRIFKTAEPVPSGNPNGGFNRGGFNPGPSNYDPQGGYNPPPRSNPGRRWQACRSLEECRARNG